MMRRGGEEGDEYDDHDDNNSDNQNNDVNTSKERGCAPLCVVTPLISCISILTISMITDTLLMFRLEMMKRGRRTAEQSPTMRSRLSHWTEIVKDAVSDDDDSDHGHGHGHDDDHYED